MVVATAQAQSVKEAEISEQDSLLLTRNLLRIAIFNISYIRGLFPEKYFNDKSVPALEMKIKKLMPMDAESRRLIDWMEKGVYDALQKKYLKTLLFCICEKEDGPMIEEYAFSFSYSSSSEEICMNVTRSGNKRHGTNFKSNTVDITPNQMRSSACKMIRTLVQLMRTLDRMPEERTILMKLYYYDEVTPADYEPPFFTCCEDNANNSWPRTPLKMKIGDVNSKYFMLALKIKSVLDPCEDENDQNEDREDPSLDGSPLKRKDDIDYQTSTDSENSEDKSQGKENGYSATEAENPKTETANDHHMSDSDDVTEDSEQEAQNLARVKEWILSRHVNTLDLADVLSHFPDVSVASTEEVIQTLIKEGLLSQLRRDFYRINRPKENKPDITSEDDPYCLNEPIKIKATDKVDEDSMYMKALYHALPMEYVSIPKLQSKLEGHVNQATVRKFIEKMASDGFIEARVSSNRRLGRRVIKSEKTKAKLLHLKKAFEKQPQEMQRNATLDKSINPETPALDKDSSTYARLHSMGSDKTRHGQSPGQNGSLRSGQTVGFKKPASPLPFRTGIAKPAASRQSTATGTEGHHYTSSKSNFATDQAPNGRSNCNNVEVFSQDTPDSNFEDCRSRKTSTVKEPIYHHAKRQKV